MSSIASASSTSDYDWNREFQETLLRLLQQQRDDVRGEFSSRHRPTERRRRGFYGSTCEVPFHVNKRNDSIVPEFSAIFHMTSKDAVLMFKFCASFLTFRRLCDKAQTLRVRFVVDLL
jgi:hypothetical protein